MHFLNATMAMVKARGQSKMYTINHSLTEWLNKISYSAPLHSNSQYRITYTFMAAKTQWQSGCIIEL